MFDREDNLDIGSLRGRTWGEFGAEVWWDVIVEEREKRMWWRRMISLPLVWAYMSAEELYMAAYGLFAEGISGNS